MKAVIVSDLHIGSRYFLAASFDRFLDEIPADCEFILNGDVIDNLYTNLTLSHRGILDRIIQLSLKQRVIWVRGNHDRGYQPEEAGKIEFRKTYLIHRQLLICHGDYFDEIMPRSQVFMKAFTIMHNLRIKLGARPVHVAEYAKAWKSLYRYLCRNVMLNAANYARQKGYQAVTCGHTHYAEDRMVGGIRYINTGAWTELPVYFLKVNGSDVKLKTVSS